jgi:hypothetical protein
MQGHCRARIKSQAHLRLSWMSCGIVSFGWPLRFSRTPATLRLHSSVSRRESRSTGTIQATGLLWRVMVVLLPRLASSTSSQNCSFASATVFVMLIWSFKMDIFAIANHRRRNAFHHVRPGLRSGRPHDRQQTKELFTHCDFSRFPSLHPDNLGVNGRARIFANFHQN